ncbi:hypothetical protein BDW22DRAFT_1426116 [Trametopsis cervina]|nr:hypothetical protein BDW22DRAFT_1426116 [Trametopsis cervina]
MKSTLSFFITLTVFATAAFAAPAKSSQCNTSNVKLILPPVAPGAPSLATPLASGPKFIALAVGTQNYTCGAAGTYTSAGAFAELFDLSCVSPKAFDTLTEDAFAVWKVVPSFVTPQKIISTLAGIGSPEVLGQHYFVTNTSGGALTPKWDFTSASEAGNPNAYVLGARTGTIPSPTNPTVDVDWLSLKNAGGELADQVFRVQTQGGQPPSSCTPGSPEIDVKYTSQYWFYGGSA